MPRSTPARLLLALATMLAALAWVWRFQLANGFAATFGDRYDAVIEIALLQHWANVLAGAEAWNRVAWFHPAAGTLGYNDGYLVSGLLYALGRGFGLSPFAAADLAHTALKALGFAGMALLLRRAGQVRFGWALFGAALFTVADLTVQHANHGQLFTLGLAPWAALAAWAAAQAVGAGDRRAVLRHGVLFAAVFALWISTGYYLAWFFALYLLVLAAFAAKGAWRPLLASWQPLAIAAAAAVLLMPFLLVYLPKARETGMHAPDIALHTTLWPIDLLNTGSANLVWGWLPGAIRASVAPGLTTNPDAVFGMPPLFLLGSIAAILWAQRSAERRLAPIGAALLVCWLLMLNLGGVFPWRAVQLLVPGAGGIRVVGRFAILLLLPATCRSFAVIQATQPAELDPALDRLYNGNVDAMLLASLWRMPTVDGVSTFAPPGWDFADTIAPDYPARLRRYAVRFGLRGLCVLDTRRPQPWSRL